MSLTNNALPGLNKRESDFMTQSQESVNHDFSRRNKRRTTGNALSKENFADAVEEIRRNSIIETREALNPQELYHVELAFLFQFIKVMPMKWTIARCFINKPPKAEGEVLSIRLANPIGTLDCRFGFEPECLYEKKGKKIICF